MENRVSIFCEFLRMERAICWAEWFVAVVVQKGAATSRTGETERARERERVSIFESGRS